MQKFQYRWLPHPSLNEKRCIQCLPRFQRRINIKKLAKKKIPAQQYPHKQYGTTKRHIKIILKRKLSHILWKNKKRPRIPRLRNPIRSHV